MATAELAPMPTETDAVPQQFYRFTIEQYDRMAEAGVLGKYDRVFLWEGMLVQKMTKNPPHVYSTAAIVDATRHLVPEGWFLFQEGPMNLAGASVPEPDVIVVRGALRDYRRRRPTVADVAMVVEVSDSSLAQDRGMMLRAYAANAIPAYWIVAIPDERFEVYSDPSGPAETPTYRKVEYYIAGQEAPLVLGGREVGRIVVADILP